MDRAGKPLEPPMKGSFPCRDDRPVARSARRILRKPLEASEKRASPADAFCAEAPCPRATSLLCRGNGNPKSEGGHPIKFLLTFSFSYAKY